MREENKIISNATVDVSDKSYLKIRYTQWLNGRHIYYRPCHDIDSRFVNQGDVGINDGTQGGGLNFIAYYFLDDPESLDHVINVTGLTKEALFMFRACAKEMYEMYKRHEECEKVEYAAERELHGKIWSLERQLKVAKDIVKASHDARKRSHDARILALSRKLGVNSKAIRELLDARQALGVAQDALREYRTEGTENGGDQRPGRGVAKHSGCRKTA